MKEQYRIVRREVYPQRWEYGIAAFCKESWQCPVRMVVDFRNYGVDDPVGRLRLVVAELQGALRHPVVDFKDLG